MDHPKIKVLKAESLEALVSSLSNAGLVVVPELGHDVEVLALNASLDAVIDSASNFLLVLVYFGAVNVAVSVFQDGLLDNLVNVGVVEEGAEADSWDFSAVVALELGDLGSDFV